MSPNRVLLAVSGGVDSTTAAVLLQQQGYQVHAVTMKLFCYVREAALESCCSIESTQIAQAAMQLLGVTHEVIDLQDYFKQKVIEPFFASYLRGETPNPCVSCNRYARFEVLWEMAVERGCDYVATGHYARKQDAYSIKRAADSNKDQSYFLYGIQKELLPKVLFPCGDYTKPEIRQLADQYQLPTAQRPESQEVCFLPKEGYSAILQEYYDAFQPGEVVDLDGKVVGKHEGFYNYTIGQRRGTGVAKGYPVYVVGLDPVKNLVIVGPNEALMRTDIHIHNCNWQCDTASLKSFNAMGMIRYRNIPQPCEVQLLDANRAFVHFSVPQRAPTPGQSVVLYDEDRVMGGGEIERI